MRLPVVFLCSAMGMLAEQGLKPRAAISDYPANREAGRLAIGAAVLTPEQVRGSFSTDLNRGYVVVEVGVFPRDEFSLSQSDFVLRVAGSKAVSRPVAAKIIAGVLQKSASGGKDVTLYPSVGVGYGTGPRAYDPATGSTRGGGWSTSVGVGVGVGGNGPAPASTDQDRKTMELELSEKALPEGKTAVPAAGYLYFPVTGKKRNVAYDLEYSSGGERIVLPLVVDPRK